MHLPPNNELPINLLAACFNNTVATYKFYWFLAILESVESGKTKISKTELFARMIATAWYTINYFHISFGRQDRLQRAVEIVKESESLTVNANREVIFETLSKTLKISSLRQLKYFNQQVPHWFLSPWFPKMNRFHIYKESQEFSNNCIYALYEDLLIINEGWVDYLIKNIRILKDFCYWNLALFLQAKNPNVPDIPNKLIKPAVRNSLNNQKIYFWDIVLRELGTMDCIYTGKKLTIGNYAVEHFIPYAFVSHNLMWNLIPADPSFNSSKSDKLPRLEKYFNIFFSTQRAAVEIIRQKSPGNRFLDDYLTIFSDFDDIKDITNGFTKERFKERIQPLLVMASNNGFQYMV